MKKTILLFMVLCLLLGGCASSEGNGSNILPAGSQVSDAPADQNPVETEPEESRQTIIPLPDTTMDNLTDAILSVSLEEGDAYVDDSGIMQMDLKIYTYDQYDMVDIDNLKVGDTIVRHSGEAEVTSLERSGSGIIYINGGLNADGFELVTDDSGVFYEWGFNDSKNWYEIGDATIRVSVDFEYVDSSDPELGEIIFYPGSFLIGEVTDYHFTPYNTTIRVEASQIVEMHRRYIP